MAGQGRAAPPAQWRRPSSGPARKQLASVLSKNASEQLEYSKAEEVLEDEWQDNSEHTIHDSIARSHVSVAALMREVVQLRAAALVSGGAICTEEADELVARVSEMAEEHTSAVKALKRARQPHHALSLSRPCARRVCCEKS